MSENRKKKTEEETNRSEEKNNIRRNEKQKRGEESADKKRGSEHRTRRRERRSHQLSRKERRSYKLRQPRPIICKMDSKKPANAVRSVCPVKVMARTTRNDELLPWRHPRSDAPHKKIRDSVSQWVTQCQVLHL